MSCEHCNGNTPIMFTVGAPPFELCSPCYRQGYKTATPEETAALEGLAAELKLNHPNTQSVGSTPSNDPSNKPRGVSRPNSERRARR